MLARGCVFAVCSGVCLLHAYPVFACSGTDATIGDDCSFDTLDLSFDGARTHATSPEPANSVPGVTVENEGVSLPFTVNPGETAVSARASIATVRDYNASINARKAASAQALARSPLNAPPPSPASSIPLDVWSSVDVQTPDQGSHGRKFGAGADYTLSKRTTAGVGVTQETSADQKTQSASSGDTVSAYVAFKASPLLSLEQRAEWAAREQNSAGTASSKDIVTFAPSVKGSIPLGGGSSVEPFAKIQSQIDVTSGSNGQYSSTSAGAGVTYSKENDYSVQFSTDVEDAKANAASTVKSRIEFKLPLP